MTILISILTALFAMTLLTLVSAFIITTASIAINSEDAKENNITPFGTLAARAIVIVIFLTLLFVSYNEISFSNDTAILKSYMSKSHATILTSANFSIDKTTIKWSTYNKSTRIDYTANYEKLDGDFMIGTVFTKTYTVSIRAAKTNWF